MALEESGSKSRLLQTATAPSAPLGDPSKSTASSLPQGSSSSPHASSAKADPSKSTVSSLPQGGSSSPHASSAKAAALPTATEPPLPQGWEEKISKSTGKKYFFHAADNKTVWERPVAQAVRPYTLAKKAPVEYLTVAKGQQMSAEAAKLEKAWVGVGQRVGLQVWRIEKLKPAPWPTERYGEFYSGDAYICLHTHSRAGSAALAWDIHFWLGATCSQDEKGVAAYKTVELDDFLGGGPIQHREVEGHESEAFLALFDNLTVLQGGVDSGFNKMRAAEYRPRLLHLRGSRGGNVRQVEVPLNRASLNCE